MVVSKCFCISKSLPVALPLAQRPSAPRLPHPLLHSPFSPLPRVLMANLVRKVNLVILVLKEMLVLLAPLVLLDPLAPL